MNGMGGKLVIITGEAFVEKKIGGKEKRRRGGKECCTSNGVGREVRRKRRNGKCEREKKGTRNS